MSNCPFERITSSSNISWLEMFIRYSMKNTPVLLDPSFTENWTARRDWVDGDGTPNMTRLREMYGDEMVPVVSASDCEPKMMRFSDYISYCESSHSEENEKDLLYLKDWHFQASCGSEMYSPPAFLASDWVNNETWTDDVTNPLGGDYRFFYLGLKGTWTGFHSDVLSSHSWSANICGRKLWYFVPIGKESLFRSGKDYVTDLRDHKHLWEEAAVFSFIQEAGEIVFVPSNWYHQVHNLETTLSLNHNSINSSNIRHVLSFLKRRQNDVIDEIGHLADVFDETEMRDQIQLVLGADARLNFPRLRLLLQSIIADRSNDVITSSCYVCPLHPMDPRLCFSDSSCLDRFLSSCLCVHDTCDVCTSLLRSFDLSISISILSELDSLGL